MPRITTTSAVGLALLLIGPSCSDGPLLLTSTGFSSTSAELGISGGGFCLREGKPGLVFGTLQTKRAGCELSYLVVFRPPENMPADCGVNGVAFCDGRKASSNVTLKVGAAILKLDHAVSVDEKRAEILDNTLRIDDTAIDPSKGRVFLVDFGGTNAAPQQIRLELPGIRNIETSQDVLAFAAAFDTAAKGHSGIEALREP